MDCVACHVLIAEGRDIQGTIATVQHCINASIIQTRRFKKSNGPKPTRSRKNSNENVDSKGNGTTIGMEGGNTRTGEMIMASVDEPSPAMDAEKIDVDIDVQKMTRIFRSEYNISIDVFGTQLFQFLTKSFICKKMRF